MMLINPEEMKMVEMQVVTGKREGEDGLPG